MSGKFASCAANVRPAGPQPMIKTSTSLGRPSELDDMVCRSDGSEISGFPGLNPLRWNCIGALPPLSYLLREELYSISYSCGDRSGARSPRRRRNVGGLALELMGVNRAQPREMARFIASMKGLMLPPSIAGSQHVSIKVLWPLTI